MLHLKKIYPDETDFLWEIRLCTEFILTHKYFTVSQKVFSMTSSAFVPASAAQKQREEEISRYICPGTHSNVSAWDLCVCVCVRNKTGEQTGIFIPPLVNRQGAALTNMVVQGSRGKGKD